MVPVSAMVSIVIAFAALLVFPVVLLLVLCLKRKISPKPMWLGFAAFFVSQICLRLPILQALGSTAWFKAFAFQTVPYAVTIAFTAGLFEETARYLCVRFFLKRQRAFRDAVAFGLGHGFCETILLAGLAEVNNLIYAVMINSGTFQAVSAAMPAATYQQILHTLLAASTAGSFYIAIWERVSAVLFHLFATALIFRGVKTGKIRYYFFALAAHTVMDSASVLLMKYSNVWITESALFVFSLLGLLYLWKVRPHWDSEPSAKLCA